MEEKKTYNNIEVVNDGGLQCDNIKCNYTDDTLFEDYKECIGKPCPECGENLLTEDDYARSVTLRDTIDFINSMSPEKLKEFQESLPVNIREQMFNGMDFFKDAEGVDDLSEDAEVIGITVTTHKEVKAIKIKEVKDEEEEK